MYNNDRERGAYEGGGGGDERGGITPPPPSQNFLGKCPPPGGGQNIGLPPSKNNPPPTPHLNFEYAPVGNVYFHRRFRKGLIICEVNYAFVWTPTCEKPKVVNFNLVLNNFVWCTESLPVLIMLENVSIQKMCSWHRQEKLCHRIRENIEVFPCCITFTFSNLISPSTSIVTLNYNYKLIVTHFVGHLWT